MKPVFVVMLSLAVLSGCAGRAQRVAVRPAPAPVAVAELTDADGIERVPFRAGVSTVTVENMAKHSGCRGAQGAGLMTPPGPVEVYRLVCDNGAVYMAKCELRQCKPMASPVRAAPRAG